MPPEQATVTVIKHHAVTTTVSAGSTRVYTQHLRQEPDPAGVYVIKDNPDSRYRVDDGSYS